VSTSGCSVASSWVRGVVRFDPAHYAGKPGVAPVLRVALRHGFTFFAGEEKIGGRLHAYTSIPVADPSKGELPFAVDMCGLGTAMWSEENGKFNIVLILDENGNNDLDKARSNQDAITMGTPDLGELVGMAQVDVSCHGSSACLDVTADCTTGAGCITITPITSCTKRSPGCTSDESYCH
jgi:hypothetical protein